MVRHEQKVARCAFGVMSKSTINPTIPWDKCDSPRKSTVHLTVHCTGTTIKSGQTALTVKGQGRLYEWSQSEEDGDQDGAQGTKKGWQSSAHTLATEQSSNVQNNSVPNLTKKGYDQTSRDDNFTVVSGT